MPLVFPEIIILIENMQYLLLNGLKNGQTSVKYLFKKEVFELNSLTPTLKSLKYYTKKRAKKWARCYNHKEILSILIKNRPGLNIFVHPGRPKESNERRAELLPEEGGEVRVAADSLRQTRHKGQQAVQEE